MIAEIILITNMYRSLIGLPTLVENPVLNASAKYKACDMVENNYWGRSKLNPTNANKRFMDFEYPQADIAFLGHTHQSEVCMFEKGGRERLAVIGGTYKLEKDEWAAKRGIGMRSGQPGHVVFLYPEDHRMVAFKDFDAATSFMRALIFEHHAKQGVELYNRP